jgi:hypothetical protein
MKYFIILLIILAILNVIVSSLIRKQIENNKTKENFDNNQNSECPNNTKKCEDDFAQPWINYDYGGRPKVVYINGYEKVGDNCYCRQGLKPSKDETGNCRCLDPSGGHPVSYSASYYIYNGKSTITNPPGITNPPNVYGVNSKEGDDCWTDTDCGQIEVLWPNRLSSPIKNLSNLRCNYPYPYGDSTMKKYGIYPPYDGTSPGKCVDRETLYNIK